MEDREFFDHLYQMWAKTTHAENGYWKYQKDEKSVLVDIESIDKDEWEQTIAFGAYEVDADWITAVHGCFPDLCRRLHAALDEADRADFDRDARECRIAELEAEVAELKADLEGLIAG